MNKENTEKLLYAFPNLYLDLGKYNFRCGDGWFDLIYQLSNKLEAIYPDIRATQVKEKFGGLRFYITGVGDERCEEIFKLIHKTEAESLSTCEDCGSKGKDVKQTKSGWVQTLCDDCKMVREAF